MTVAATQDIDASRATLHGGGLDLSAANLRNPGGKLTSSGDAIIKLGGELDNTGGTIAAAGKARIDAASRSTATAPWPAATDHHHQWRHRQPARPAAGRRHADADGFEPDNSNTLTASNAPAKGVLGKVVSIVAGRVNNQGGAISAGQTWHQDRRAGQHRRRSLLARRCAHRGRHAQEHAGQAAGGQEPTVIVKALQGLGAALGRGPVL